MSSLPATSPPDGAATVSRSTGSAIQPESLATELERILTEVEDDSAFQQSVVHLTAAATGARAALLYQAEDGRLQAKILFSPDHTQGVLTSQQQVDLVAYTAVQKASAQRATITQADGTLTLLCVPFSGEERTPMALAILLGPERAPYLEPVFALLQMVPQVFARRYAHSASLALEQGFEQSTLLVDLFSKVARATEFRQGVSMICEEFRELLGCHRVAIGLGNQRKCKVYGLSGAGKIEKRSHATSLLAGTMRETMGVDATVSWPQRDDLKGVLTSSSQPPLLEAVGASEVISTPLETALPNGKSEQIGAWSFLWHEEAWATPQQVALIEAAAPHVSSLIHLSSQSLPRGLRGAWKRFWTGASQVKQAAVVIFPILFALVMILPVPYRVGADCRLQPKQTRQIAAPFDGILERAVVKPGVTVNEGDLLAVLDGKEIRVRLAEAIARRESALKQRDQAMAKGDVSAAQLAQLEADGYDLEVELLQHRRDNLEIRAPISGTVLSGNLERSQGVPVVTGQKLFDIAPIDSFEVEIHVPDSEVNQVEVGQTVQFRLESQARFRFESTLEEIYPISEVQEEKNVFICLSSLPNEDGRLRPGMQGKARIVTPAKPVGWIVFHRLWDSIRLRLW